MTPDVDMDASLRRARGGVGERGAVGFPHLAGAAKHRPAATRALDGLWLELAQVVSDAERIRSRPAATSNPAKPAVKDIASVSLRIDH